MIKTSFLISAALGFAAIAAVAQAAPDAPATAAQPSPNANTVGEVVVTAERRPENQQSTPVQVSAFSQQTLDARRIEGGMDLETAVPNMDMSRGQYGGYSLEIRGVGTLSIGGEPGVSMLENFVSVLNNHFQDTDFYDTDRVEVERGPQGTLYGRNATAGAVNIITNRPTNAYSASITAEGGAYDEAKFSGFVNLPLSDILAVRIAGFSLNRGGFGTNTVTDQSVDGRALWSGRVSVAFTPNERFHAYATYEHFDENDDRNIVGSQRCDPDAGPSQVDGVPTTPTEQGFLSQGCKDTSLYSPASLGTTNTSANIAGIYAQELGLLSGNGDAGHAPQGSNLHDIASAANPTYKARENFFNLDMTWDVTDTLQLESITAYNDNSYFFGQDYDRFVSNVPFNTSPQPGCLVCLVGGSAYTHFVYPSLFPGGVVTDGQTGNTNGLRVLDQGDGWSREWTQEFRLTSSFNGPVNFSAGALYYNLSSNDQYYVFFNSLTALTQAVNTLEPGTFAVDQSNPPNGTGHNYYLSNVSAATRSYAGFGELYYDITPDVRLTLGLRETLDQKYDYPSENPLGIPGPPGLTALASNSNNTLATSGRAILSWTPHLSFTDHTLIYGSYTRGYKAGGFNTPCGGASPTSASCGFPLTYAPEYVNAFELGTKNTLEGGRLTLNLTGFFYDYNGYQIASLIDQAGVSQNINAQIMGLEYESVWVPVDHLTLNASVGYLHTRITGGAVVDELNPTGGDPNLSVVKNGANGENCVVNTQALAAYLHLLNTFGGGGTPGVAESALLGNTAFGGSSPGVCGGGAPSGLYSYQPGQNVVLAGGVGEGVATNLTGKRLPEAPDWTLTLGAQYVWQLPATWTATVRGDFYWQDSSYARIFNDPVDYLEGWENLNASLTFANRPLGVKVQVYVKNALDAQPITGTFVSDPAAGLFVNTFTLDPRTYGVAVTKQF